MQHDRHLWALRTVGLRLCQIHPRRRLNPHDATTETRKERGKGGRSQLQDGRVAGESQPHRGVYRQMIPRGSVRYPSGEAIRYGSRSSSLLRGSTPPCPLPLQNSGNNHPPLPLPAGITPMPVCYRRGSPQSSAGQSPRQMRLGLPIHAKTFLQPHTRNPGTFFTHYLFKAHSCKSQR